jgi:hypothetical protein
MLGDGSDRKEWAIATNSNHIGVVAANDQLRLRMVLFPPSWDESSETAEGGSRYLVKKEGQSRLPAWNVCLLKRRCSKCN